MRARQANKILRQQAENSLSKHKTSRYWFKRWVDFGYFLGGKSDHRIIKAIDILWRKKKIAAKLLAMKISNWESIPYSVALQCPNGDDGAFTG